MKIKQLTAFSILAATTTLAYADYQGQIDVGVQSQTLAFDDTNDEYLETSTTVLEARYYLDAVASENKPVREAAFMGRNSYIRTGFIQSDIEQGTADDSTDNLFVRADIHIGETDFRVGGELSTYSEDTDDLSATSFSAFFGWYPTEMGLLTIELESVSGDDKLDSDYTSTDLIVAYKQVIPLADTLLSVGGGIKSGSTGVELAAGNSQEEDLVSTQIFAQWYPTQQFSFGARIDSTVTDYNYSNTDTRSESGFYVNATYDFNELVGLSAEIGSLSATNDNILGNDTDESGSNASLALQMRF